MAFENKGANIVERFEKFEKLKRFGSFERKRSVWCGRYLAYAGFIFLTITLITLGIGLVRRPGADNSGS
jgi:hypothetical protein